MVRVSIVIRFLSLVLTHPFYVCRVSSQNLSCGHHYRFKMTSWNQCFIAEENLLGQPVCLLIQVHSQTLYYHAYVAGVSVYSKLQQGWAYKLEIVSPWYLLTRQQHHRIWVNVNLADVIEKLMKVYVNSHVHYQWDIAKPSSRYRVITQYGERDYSLLQKLLQQDHLISYMEQKATYLIIHIAAQWPAKKVKYFHCMDNTGFCRDGAHLYNIHVHYSWPQQQVYLEATVYNQLLALGDIIHLYKQEHDYYQVQAIVLLGEQGRLIDQHAASKIIMRVRLWPLSKQSIPLVQEYQYDQNSYPYVLTATVKQAHWDAEQQQGHYRVYYHFDESHTLSPVLMRAELGIVATKQQSGWHLPLSVGSQVLLACLEGAWDQVVIIGPISTLDMPATVNQTNEQQIVWRQLGSEWLWQDTPNDTYMTLRSDEQSIQLNHHGAYRGIRIMSDVAGIDLMSTVNLTAHAKECIHISSQASNTFKAQGDYTVQCMEGNIDYQSADAINIAAERFFWCVQHELLIVANSIRCYCSEAIMLQSAIKQSYQAHNIMRLYSQRDIELVAQWVQYWRVGQSKLCMNSQGILLHAYNVKFKATKIVFQVVKGRHG